MFVMQVSAALGVLDEVYVAGLGRNICYERMIMFMSL